MKINFTVLQNEVLAMRRLVSCDESRMILNGVHFEVGRHQVLMVATDGRRLGVLKYPISGFDADPVGFTVPIEILDRIEPPTDDEDGDDYDGDGNVTSELDFSYDTESFEVEIRHERSGVKVSGQVFELATRKFPKWRDVIPKGEAQQVGNVGLNARLLDGFRLVVESLGSSYNGLALEFHGPDGPIVVGFKDCDRFYGVLMPMHYEGWAPKRWDWMGV